jgi:hypothetical protein
MITFFRINLPFGIRRIQNGEWMAFNREYLPIGFNSSKTAITEDDMSRLTVSSRYAGLTDEFLMQIATPDRILRDETGHIKSIYLYNETNYPLNNDECWKEYCDKLFKLAALKLPSSKAKYRTISTEKKCAS